MRWKKAIAAFLAVFMMVMTAVSSASALDLPSKPGKYDPLVFLSGLLEDVTDESGNIPSDYYRHLSPKGEIEAIYTAKGPYKVSHFDEASSSLRMRTYRVYYPSELKQTDTKYPCIVMVNGTGIQARKYTAILKHLASWGFVVIGCDDSTSWDGWSASKCLEFLLKKNENENSRLYGHVDTKNIGIDGHSQGGVGAINAATLYKNSKYYKAVIAESCTSQGLALGLEWPYDPSLLMAPTLLLAGTGETDSTVIAPPESLQENYDAIDNGKLTAMARRVGVDHGDVLTHVEGYRTAWFCYLLKGDEQAKKAFAGKDAELLSNPNYTDAAIKYSVTKEYHGTVQKS